MDPYIKRAYLPLVRQHVRDPKQWAEQIGSDYWLVTNPGIDIGIADSDTDPGAQLGLAAHGWTATSLVNTAGAAADFASSADAANPNHLLTNADGDLLDSPAIFGEYGHMSAVQKMLGMPDLPRYLVCEAYAAMTVHSADEQDSIVCGFIEDGGTPITAADILVGVITDGTNFYLAGAGSDIDAGAADDALWHWFKIALDRVSGKFHWSIDGTIQGTDVGTIIGDEFPVSFGFAAGVTNRPALSIAHVYYDWGTFNG